MTNNDKRGKRPLSPTQWLAINYLVNGSNKTETARRVGRSRQALGLWMKTPAFTQALHEAQNKKLEELQAKYQTSEFAWFDTLNNISADEKAKPADRIRAIQVLFNQHHQIREWHDFEERLSEIEDELRRENEKS